jgi:AcrR family transcriptional regulator
MLSGAATAATFGQRPWIGRRTDMTLVVRPPAEQPETVCHALGAVRLQPHVRCRIHSALAYQALVARLVKQLEVEDWERAALQAIAADGLAAVAVEPLARGLGVTKGSFYAHFRDRDELVIAALRRWEQLHIHSFAAVAERFQDPTERLRALIELATSAVRGHPVISRLLLDSEDPRVRAALRRITEFRLAHLDATFRELGVPSGKAAHRATIAYAAYIGLLQLVREVPERLADDQVLVRELLHTLTDPKRDTSPAK